MLGTMDAIPDYLAKLGASLTGEPGFCRLVHKGCDTGFLGVTPDEIRGKFNRSMHDAVAYYARNVAKVGVTMTSRQIEEAAFRVVAHHLHIYCMWRQNYPQYKEHPLLVSNEDLEHVQSNDECWHYCESEFGAGYVTYAAALTGMTREEFLRYEQGRNAFYDR